MMKTDMSQNHLHNHLQRLAEDGSPYLGHVIPEGTASRPQRAVGETPATPNTPITRADFLRAILRGGLLAGIGAAGWRAVGGRKGLDRSRHNCVNKSICCQCRVFRDCGLPAALSAKQAGEDFSS